MTIYLNHCGYPPQSYRRILVGGQFETGFSVINSTTGSVDHLGQLVRVKSDFGQYTAAEFSIPLPPGSYAIHCGTENSTSFRIGPDAYDDTIGKIQGYFKLQRCGNNPYGWNGPCHLDDGLRGDTLTHQEVTGGWHDACDVRKWVGATVFGLLGLAQVEPFSTDIEDELRWGNQYFLAMQEPAGYLMNFIGGDYYVHADNNRWTDNIADGKDDRLINVLPCEMIAQWVFVLSESIISQHLIKTDLEYARICLAAARLCADWALKNHSDPSAGELGAGISALVKLFQVTNEPVYQDAAIAFARKLLSMQVTRQVDSRSSVWGFFWDRCSLGKSPSTYEPYRDIWRGCWPLIGLVDLLEAKPDHLDVSRWQAAIELYIDRYIAELAGRNAFCIVPYGLYRSDPGGNRDLGRFWYRYFHEVNPVWYVGINSNLASTGIGLLKAAKLLSRPDWAGLAQRQLDWIIGCNPFNASTIMGVGLNNPQHMFGGEFLPSTPFLPGAVMNGISGDTNDVPQLRPGSWQECEYWTPMVAFTLWLLSELRK